MGCRGRRLPMATNESYWRAAHGHPRAPDPWVPNSERYDVVVVGAGIAGLTTPPPLSTRGARGAVFERHTVGAGTTGGSTAKATALQGTIYTTLIDKHSEATAIRYAAANLNGVERLARIVEDLSIDCQFTRARAVTYATTDVGVERVHRKVDRPQAAGLDVHRPEVAELPFEVLAAVGLAEQAHLDPIAYLDALAASIRANGGIIVENTAVLDVDEPA